MCEILERISSFLSELAASCNDLKIRANGKKQPPPPGFWTVSRCRRAGVFCRSEQV